MNPPTPWSVNDVIERMMALSDNGYYCSQIMITVAIEQRGQTLPDLTRAMAGLGYGCGFFQETCGILTGAACIIGWHAGKGAADETESPHFAPMLEELNDWFRSETKDRFNGTRCADIAGEKAGTPESLQICGTLLLNTFEKTSAILQAYGV